MNDSELREALADLVMTGKLTSWEQDFAEGVNDHDRPLTDRQRVIVEQIIQEHRA